MSDHIITDLTVFKAYPDGMREVDPREGLEGIRHMLASGKSGPAFNDCASNLGPSFEDVRRTLFDTPLAVDLARSLQLQAVAAAGNVIYALTRHCFLDAMPAWTRLLTALNLTVAPVTIELIRGDHHNARILQAIVLALSSAEGPEASMRWANADALMRSYARYHADQCHAEAREIREAANGENIEEADITAAQAVCFRQADVFTAFANGGR